MEGAERSALIEVEALEIRRAGRRVVSGASLRLGAGEAAILRGPNGVGKSTLLRALAGLCPIAGGVARIGGHDLRETPAAAQAALAYAGHLDSLKLPETPLEALRFHADLLGGDRARIPEALRAFHLDSLAEAPARHLSAGQRRRLGLARLLLTDRPVWLLDEPTTALDAASTAALVEAMKGHLARGGAILAATHLDLGLSGARSFELTPGPSGSPEAAEAESW
ncbi:heme ABC exporter ATP-binding protein CcmA [Neomegalonema sp.]|uniref:heme ABC exporter ATP-binding protein CcmA n=1 Tax=Neomegalonema sp. TaxID=2039713 RepID=UPI002631B0B9|nr:heme ABC exporter ATP-binding protein CcmA [Neomegalonema sp.]MDD2868915.1 heme ABC exporter ATP-binding protein CcmA [Neomegalonema sp.]